MINLIRNELYKIIHKRSTLVILIIMFLFVVLTNFVYTRIGSMHIDIEYGYNHGEALAYISKNEPNDLNLEDYIQYKVIYNNWELSQKYPLKWQLNVIYSELSEAYSNLYRNEYYKNTKEVEKIKKDIDLMLKNLEDGNWKFYIDRRIANLQSEIDYLKNINYQAGSLKEKETLKSIERLNIQIEMLEYRKKNDLPMDGTTYLDDAINMVEGISYEYLEYKYSPEEKNYSDSSIKEYEEARYILDKKVDINNYKTLRGIIVDFFEEYYFLILVFIIMIAGAIVSEEFNKGTIKSLLILPYSRTKILLAKYITTVIALLFAIVVLLLMQLLVGGIFFGFSSLSIPFVTYNLATKSIMEMNIFVYFGLMSVAMLPKLLLLGTLAFALSSIFTNTAAAIAITFCGYIGESIVNMLALHYNVKFLNYFVTTNWNFNNLLFGGKSQFDLSLTHSIIVCLAYFLLMIIVAFIVFKKKDIKNI